MKLPATFAALIQQLADEHHQGHFYPIAKRMPSASALVYGWRNGTIRQPTPQKIRLLCNAYGLDFQQVLELAMRSASSAQLPPSTGRKRRPVPIRGGSSAAQPVPSDSRGASSAPPSPDYQPSRTPASPSRNPLIPDDVLSLIRRWRHQRLYPLSHRARRSRAA